MRTAVQPVCHQPQDLDLTVTMMTIVTTSTAEHSFSSLRRVKTYLRSTMTQSRLNNLLLLYVHSSDTDSLDLKDIARQFVSVNDHRLHYFGKI